MSLPNNMPLALWPNATRDTHTRKIWPAYIGTALLYKLQGPVSWTAKSKLHELSSYPRGQPYCELILTKIMQSIKNGWVQGRVLLQHYPCQHYSILAIRPCWLGRNLRAAKSTQRILTWHGYCTDAYNFGGYQFEVGPNSTAWYKRDAHQAKRFNYVRSTMSSSSSSSSPSAKTPVAHVFPTASVVAIACLPASNSLSQKFPLCRSSQTKVDQPSTIRRSAANLQSSLAGGPPIPVSKLLPDPMKKASTEPQKNDR